MWLAILLLLGPVLAFMLGFVRVWWLLHAGRQGVAFYEEGLIILLYAVNLCLWLRGLHLRRSPPGPATFWRDVALCISVWFWPVLLATIGVAVGSYIIFVIGMLLGMLCGLELMAPYVAGIPAGCLAGTVLVFVLGRRAFRRNPWQAIGPESGRPS
jgi:hypothetical protein